jgi:cysteine desulfurase
MGGKARPVSGPIYLDYNATTPVDPAVIEAMLPYLTNHFGNPSSGHQYGYEALSAMEGARAQVAGLLNVPAANVVFTGGGSEGDNLAIKGPVFARAGKPCHIITSAIEHPAVLNTVAYLKTRFGVQFTVIPVDSYGMVDPDDVRAALRKNTLLISLMHANNEVGTIQPVADIGRIAAEHGVLLHVDAAQSAGKVRFDAEGAEISLLTIAGHKVYAPKGIGAAYIRKGVEIDPLVHGSSQEHGFRAGTEPVASMVALGAACAIARESLDGEIEHLTRLRDRLHTRLTDTVPGLQLNGHPVYRLPNTINVSFPGVAGAQVLAACPEVAASTGSACHAASPEPSPVLLAMGLSLERSLGAVRLSLGRWTTEEEVDAAAQYLGNAYRTLTALGAAV